MVESQYSLKKVTPSRGTRLPQCTNRPWGPPSVLYNGFPGASTGTKADWSWS